MLFWRAGNSSCCFFGSLAPVCVSFRVFSYKLLPCKRIEIEFNSIHFLSRFSGEILRGYRIRLLGGYRIRLLGGTVFGCWGQFPFKIVGVPYSVAPKIGGGTVFGCCCFEGKFRLKFQRKSCNFSLEISPECARPPYSVCVPNLWWYYDIIATYYNIQYYSIMRLQHYNAIILL